MSEGSRVDGDFRSYYKSGKLEGKEILKMETLGMEH